MKQHSSQSEIVYRVMQAGSQSYFLNNKNNIMKKYIFVFITAAAIACNNSTDTKASGAGAKPAETSGDSKSAGSTTGSCSSLVLFHKGAIIEGKSYDSTGKETAGQITTITDVRDEDGVTLADAKMNTNSIIMGKEKISEMSITYKCNGEALYVDLGAVMANFKALKGAKIKANALEFPLKISVGETLPETSVSMEINTTGKGMEATFAYTDRKVESKESITTPAGTWNCFKISSLIKTSMKMG